MTEISKSTTDSSQSASTGGSTFQRPDSPSKADYNETTTSFKDQAAEAARDLKGAASGLTDKAKDAAAGATDKLIAAVEEQKSAGADYVNIIANAVRRAGKEIETDLPQAGPYLRMAAEHIENASDAVRRRDLNELVGTVQDFARRQPAVFLGGTLLAGFAAIRFLKTSAGGGSKSNFGSGRERASSSSVKSYVSGHDGSYGRGSSTQPSQTRTASGDPGGISPMAPGFERSPGRLGEPRS